MTTRTVQIALASYWPAGQKREDGCRFGLLGQTVDVHPDDLERFDRLNGDEVAEDEPAAEADLPDEADDLPEDLRALNLAELREIAKDQGVDLGGATRKADIIAALSA